MPLGICLSVSDPGVAETVDPAGTQFGECEPVLGRAVPAIASEPVAGVRLGEGAHRVVTEDLATTLAAATAALRVGPGQALHLGAERQVAVSKTAPGPRLKRGESPAQGFAVSQADAVTVDPPGRVRHY